MAWLSRLARGGARVQDGVTGARWNDMRGCSRISVSRGYPRKASTTIPAQALEPKRERGRTRVAAILDAGGAVFAEKGYDAAR